MLAVETRDRIPKAQENPNCQKPFHLLVREYSFQFPLLSEEESASMCERWEFKFFNSQLIRKGGFGQIYSIKKGYIAKVSSDMNESLAEFVANQYLERRKLSYRCKLVEAAQVNIRLLDSTLVKKSIFIYEHAGIDLYTLSFSHPLCPPRTILVIAFQALNLVSKLHHPSEEGEEPHVHGDMSASNFLFDIEKNLLSIGDWSTLTQIALRQEQTEKSVIPFQSYLTACVLAPEVMFQCEPTEEWRWDMRASEVWALGEVLLMLYTKDFYYRWMMRSSDMTILECAHMQTQRQGDLPKAILDHSPIRDSLYNLDGVLNPIPDIDLVTRPKLPTLEETLQINTQLRLSQCKDLVELARDAWYCDQIVELIRRTKNPDPALRESSLTLLSTFDREQQWLYPIEEKNDT